MNGFPHRMPPRRRTLPGETVRLYAALLLTVTASHAMAQSPASVPTPAALQGIREPDLRADLFAMAGERCAGARPVPSMRCVPRCGPRSSSGRSASSPSVRAVRISSGSTCDERACRRSAVRCGLAGSRSLIWTDITPASNTVGDVVGRRFRRRRSRHDDRRARSGRGRHAGPNIRGHKDDDQHPRVPRGAPGDNHTKRRADASRCRGGHSRRRFRR